MQRTFKAKIDLWFRLSVYGLLSLMCYFVWEQVMVPALVLLILNVLIVKILLKTEYVIGQGKLELVCGYFPRKVICISDIVGIRKTCCPALDYAPSFDRLEIRCKHVSRFVSPEDKTGFVKELQKYNPDLGVEFGMEDVC